MPTLTPLELTGPAGRLEALLDLPDGPPRAAALLCHPHPLQGGTMHTHAVFRAMRALRDEGAAVLRFNFRGVGRSDGTHDFGKGERDDARAAFDELRGRFPGLTTLCGGFSFGAWIGLSVGVAVSADGLLGIGVPCELFRFDELEGNPRPKAFIHAERDQLTTTAQIEAVVARAQPARLWKVRGASHLFTESLDAYESTAREAARWLLERIGLP
jgi:alpha/beta superfamily hydrolase